MMLARFGIRFFHLAFESVLIRSKLLKRSVGPFKYEI